MMQDWIRTALVGTANVSQDAATVADIDALLPAGRREQRILWQAGAFATYVNAGQPLVAATPAVAPAPEDVLPETPLALDSIMAAAVNGEIAGLGEWLVPRMLQAQRRLPASLLPAVLTKTATWQVWQPVIGLRGHWLAAQHPDWQRRLVARSDADMSEAALLRDWNEGDTATRAAALAALRTLDAAKARELLAAILPKEKAEQRLAFVQALASTLHADDEALLESLLDDRGQAVRKYAADLLARLPSSALMRRMKERADTCVRWGKSAGIVLGLGKKLTLTVEIPNDLPKDWVRDGIGETPVRGEGKRAYWLRQLLAFHAPRNWTDATGETPESLLELLSKDEWSDALLAGCAEAACHHANTEWAAPLLRLATSGSAALRLHQDRLWHAVTPTVRDAELCQQLKRGNVRTAHACLRELAAPWPSEVTRTFAQTFLVDEQQRRTPEELLQRYDLADIAQLALLRAADADLPLLSPIADLYAGCLSNAFAGTPSMLNRAREIVALIHAKQTVIKEMPL